jgi:hypothetical protein
MGIAITQLEIMVLAGDARIFDFVPSQTAKNHYRYFGIIAYRMVWFWYFLPI